ncbi:MAG TPA: tetratricopeptide repeat protein, partial [bacterium]|nr:tetratricopeptide repeat protein [bacterium]
AVNIAIHIACSLALFALCRILLLRAREEGFSPLSERGSLAAALTAGLVFAVHPAGTQAVTYIVQRLASLTALFYMLSLFLYASGRMRVISGKIGGWKFFAAAGVFAALAMLTKQNAFTLPASALMMELLFFRPCADEMPGHRPALVAAGVMLLLAIPAAVFIATGASLDDISELTRETDLLSRKEYFLTQLAVVGTYLRLTLLPVWQRLDYSVPVIASALEARAILFALLHAGVLAFAFASLRKRRAVSFGIFLFYVSLAVESGLIPIRDLCVEHRMYLPYSGIILALSALAWEVQEKLKFSRSAMWAVVAAIAVALGAATHMRNEVWKTPEGIWGEVLRYDGRSWRANYNLGKELEANGRLKEAAEHYRDSIEVWPTTWAYNNLGNVYLKSGRKREAIEAYEKAIVRDYDYAPSHANLAVALETNGNLKEARRKNLDALKIDPRLAAARYNLGRIDMAEGNLFAAERELREALRIDPDHPLANYRLGVVLKRTGRKTEAREKLERALELNPKNKRARAELREISR